MKKIIILTVLIGSILAFLIFKVTYHEEINILALGDGLALGETAFNVRGYSFNDYLKDYYEENTNLKEYITEFASKRETTSSLLLKITTNYTLESPNISITQAIAKAQVLTLAIGMDELNLEEEITSPIIAKYLTNIEKIIQLIKIYNKKSIIVIGIYETQKISPEKASEINNKLQALCSSQNVTYIDISSVSKQESFFFTPKSYYLNYQGHRYIYEQILAKLT